MKLLSFKMMLNKMMIHFSKNKDFIGKEVTYRKIVFIKASLMIILMKKTTKKKNNLLDKKHFMNQKLLLKLHTRR
jgi:hypothetical protein